MLKQKKHFCCFQRIVISNRKTILSFHEHYSFQANYPESYCGRYFRRNNYLLNKSRNGPYANALKSTLKTAMAKGKNETRVKA
jgi:hypothetical protein